MVKELVFRDISKAREAQKLFKKTYGYTPKLYIFPEEKKFVIAKPSGLRRI